MSEEEKIVESVKREVEYSKNSASEILCKEIIDEAKAIIEYTCNLNWANDNIKSVLSEIRKDKLGHLQKLVIALTEIMDGEQTPTTADQIDNKTGVEKGDKKNE